MTSEQMTMVVESYGLEHILTLFDIEPSYVIELLIEEGLIDEQELFDAYFT